MSNYERHLDFTAAYDKRNPDPSRNYGIHGVELRAIVKGDEGAVQFVLYTGWLLPETVGVSGDDRGYGMEATSYRRALAAHNTDLQPMPADLGYHSKRPMYEGHEPMEGECEWAGGPCYYDGSGLNAWQPFVALLRGGSDGLWKFLEDYYCELFERQDVTA